MSRSEIRPVAAGQPGQDKGTGNTQAKAAAKTSAEAFRARYAAEFDPRNSFFPAEIAPADAPLSAKPIPAAVSATAGVAAPAPERARSPATATAPAAARLSRPSLLAGAIVAGVGLLLAGAGLGYVFFSAPRAPATGSPDATTAAKRVEPPKGAASGAITSAGVPTAPQVDSATREPAGEPARSKVVVPAGVPVATPPTPTAMIPRAPAPVNRVRGANATAAPAASEPAAVLPVTGGPRSSVTHTRSDQAAPAAPAAPAPSAVESSALPLVLPRPAAGLPPGCTEALSALGLCAASTK